MARILGVEIPDNKKIEHALPYIQGIGPSLSKKVLTLARIDPAVRTKDLTESEISKIAQIIEKNYKIEGELRREVRDNIKRLIDIKAYRGIRHKRGLPVRGQRTRHNARTRKGPKKTMGGISAKKKIEKT